MSGGQVRIGTAHRRGQSNTSRHRIEFGDDHAVRRWNNIRADHRRQMVTKPFHSTVGNEAFRFPLIEIKSDPGRLGPAYALHVESVHTSVKTQELRSQVLEELQLIMGKEQRLKAYAPGCLDSLLAG